MPYRDIREFIDHLRDLGELKEIYGAHWNLEIGALTEIEAFKGDRERKALLFDEIPDYPKGYRVLSNAMATPERWALAGGIDRNLSRIDQVKAWKKRMFEEVRPIPPEVVKDGPILEHVVTGEAVDLYQFPAPIWHEHDGGRFIGTGDTVVMRDPDGGWLNLAVCRVQIHAKALAACYVAPGNDSSLIRANYWRQGKAAPVAIAMGQSPTLWFPCQMHFPWGCSEYDVAGYLNGAPIEVVEGPTTGLPIPATAEIVIEGYQPPPDEESHPEGPFGEQPGYYASGVRNEPVLKVTSILYRDSPIIHGAPPLRPPGQSIHSFVTGAAAIWWEMDHVVRGVKGVWIPEEGRGFIRIVSVRQEYAGHAKQVANALLGTRGGAYRLHCLIVVDDDVDITNLSEVMWAVGTRCEPAEDVDFLRNTLSSPLDPRMPPDKKERRDYTSSVMIIDATRPWAWRKEFPPMCDFSEEYKARVKAKWGHLV